jgi:3'-phosphoadenosine 5'-phosphosulfate sulfotransferase (PAPS reductase)/FAD synthetase
LYFKIKGEKQMLRHVLGISGGKDSAALAIYMKEKYPSLNVDYYTSDTGKELDETYQLIENLEIFLGKKIAKLSAAAQSHENPFDHFWKLNGFYLPSATARWCTKKLKLEPFEKFVGTEPVVSYVGIRGDEDREGYISTKQNIQAIFPFRKNIWSEDVVNKALINSNIEQLMDYYRSDLTADKSQRFEDVLRQPLSIAFKQSQKLNLLLDTNVRDFNRIVFEYLRTTTYPLALETVFPLIDNEDVLVRDDIFRILRESGVGVPAYYEKLPFETEEGKRGEYARSRSGCFFCFYQQKIEWVWLYENHTAKFFEAMEYEKDGYTWQQDERLEDLINPERIAQIKNDYIKRTAKNKSKIKSPYLIDMLDDEESTGCAACFI